jgi:non-canonical purine NTP pyrophosphatase (RdgB/HAM1 family)
MARALTGQIVVATHNGGKLREMNELLAPHGVEAISAGSLGLPEPEETGTTFMANARIKALAAALATGLPALADDSGICVAALEGAPGIYSARWAGPSKDFAHAMAKVEAALRERDAFEPQQRRAWFVSALCVAWPGRAHRGVRGPHRRHHRLAAARHGGLRLRPDIPARRPCAHLRRDDRGRKTRPAAAGPWPLPPRQSLRHAGAGLPGVGGEL